MNTSVLIEKLKRAEPCEIDIKNNPKLFAKISDNIQIKSLSNKIVIYTFEFNTEDESAAHIYAYDNTDTYLFMLELPINIIIKLLS